MTSCFTLHCCLPSLPCARVYWTGKLASRSLDLNPVNYSVWTNVQNMAYHRKISDTDWLKRMLIDCWTQQSRNTLNWVINQLPKSMMIVIKAKGAHTEFHLDKFCVQMIVALKKQSGFMAHPDNYAVQYQCLIWLSFFSCIEKKHQHAYIYTSVYNALVVCNYISVPLLQSQFITEILQSTTVFKFDSVYVCCIDITQPMKPISIIKLPAIFT